MLVGSSAGGVQGLGTLLGGLDPELPVPVLVAQHLRRSRETRIVSVLSRSTSLTIRLAEDRERPRAGTVYIAPPDHHLCVCPDGVLELTDERPVNFARPAADPLFESAGRAYGGRIIACVLTGADSDGARGVTAVRGRGGTVIVQDPETAEFHGMPKAAIETGQVDFVRGLEDIAPTINHLLRETRPAGP
ncbi:chemotaxis protein CheB [Streptomyces daliensis]|uniref:protein-glutamate methylesterase n=1 Tax=Streptomyces daliensis TaxID=299421 RepID=A0A8T4J0T4_9ACTN|nr:chemotaxis protein CheB [Streptomyces daliensis]